MKKLLACLLCLALLCPLVSPAVTSAKADGVAKVYNFYLIPDSDTRKLTKEEIWGWEYDALWYLIDEIFARHGFVFQTGGRMYNYFNAQAWYTPNSDPNNSKACYSQMNSTEWYNEHLIKVVKEEMEAQKTKNDKGTKKVSSYLSINADQLQGFTLMPGGKNAKWPCYSAPSTDSWRGANGKALVNVGWPWSACGWDNGWLLISYETNNGSVRIGYVQPTWNTHINTQLSFSRTEATVLNNCTLTDDPMRTGTSMRSISAGEKVTYLTTFYGYGGNSSWAYVETTVDGLTARGFIPSSALDVVPTEEVTDTSSYESTYLGDG